MKPPEGAVDLSDTEIAVLKFGFRDELLRSSAPYRTAAINRFTGAISPVEDVMGRPIGSTNREKPFNSALLMDLRS
jgi:hypothetical protein